MTHITDHSDSEDDRHEEDYVQTFTQVQNKLQAEDFFAKIRAEAYLKNQGERKVTLKMRGKLLAWLEKLSITTFKFSRATFIDSILILDQYLEKVDDPPASLQLIGCSALIISSKLNEEIIVAPECYVTASCNIFNKVQLMQKERQVYGQVNWKRIRMGPLRAVRVGCLRLNMQEKMARSEEILAMLLKDQRVYAWKDSKLIYSVLSFTKMHEFDTEEILALTKQL